MPDNPEHKIQLIKVRRPLEPLMYRACCSCGRYRSALHHYPGRAEQAGKMHVNAKTVGQRL